jgi:hypothetical protein
VAKKSTHEKQARRKYVLRRDSTIGSAEREIAKVFDIPKESVRLVNPNGRKARADKLVNAFLHDWGWL